MVGGAYQLVDARLGQAGIFHEEGTVVSVEFGNLSLQFSGDDQHLLTFLQGGLHSIGVWVACGGRGIVHVTDVDDGLGGEELDVLYEFLVFLCHLGIAGVAEVLQGLFVDAEHIEGFLVVLLAILQKLLHAFQLARDEVKVAHLKLQVDEFHVAHRVDATFAMRDVGVVETTQHMDEGIHGLYLGEELVAHTLTAFTQSGQVDDFDRGRHDALRVGDVVDEFEAIVDDLAHADVGLRGEAYLRFGV